MAELRVRVQQQIRTVDVRCEMRGSRHRPSSSRHQRDWKAGERRRIKARRALVPSAERRTTEQVLEKSFLFFDHFDRTVVSEPSSRAFDYGDNIILLVDYLIATK
jgi:hypothetical protein